MAEKTNPMEEFREALKENAIDDIIWKMKNGTSASRILKRE